MFDRNLSEDEQAQAIKDWIRNNALYIILGIVAAFGAFGGYSYMQDETVTKQRRASEIFNNLITLNNQIIGDPSADSTVRANALTQSEEFHTLLQALDTDSYQARMGRVQHARMLLYNQADYATIEQTIGDVINDDNPLIKTAATLLLANAAWYHQQIETALLLLDSELHDSATPLADELKGDIYLSTGDQVKAQQYYQQAVDGGSTSQLLLTKLSWVQGPQDQQDQQDQQQN